jgi:hypothetical protein
MKDIILSKNLMLTEMTRSESGKRRGISNQPTPAHIENMKILAEKVFQSIRDHFKVPIRISSGYRSRELNAIIGGSQTSQHSEGKAIDIDMDGTKITNKQIFDFIRQNLEWDQLVNEFDYSWVHVSFNLGKNRKQVLEAYKQNGKTFYRAM